MNTTLTKPSLKVWIGATRPRTLAAAVVPVALGTALAFADGKADWSSAAVALFCAVLIQIGTNFINEIYDFRKGADTAERLGPTRAVAAGLISEQAMTIAAMLVLAVAFFAGLVLVWRGGLVILMIGLASLFFAWAYTGGPYPLAYNGLGDVFVFLFFGVAAVCGTYYAQALAWSLPSLVLAVAPGTLAANILGANNLRDIQTDAAVGKRTLAVRLGLQTGKQIYIALTIAAFLVPVALSITGYGLWALLPLMALPLAYQASMQVWRAEGTAFNLSLAATARLLIIHGLLQSLGLCLSASLK
ncbi:MAG: 1,4-dihydroxy-2-naphthoate polyprenyltransferase [Rhizobacter sp.]|nr:1,4-dihydroxy-2-naphthoate polyprenyltransferase [Chlorobiales bacterium]